MFGKILLPDNYNRLFVAVLNNDDDDDDDDDDDAR